MAKQESTLKARMNDELKDALRSGDKIRLATLRLLSASVKNREIELRRDLTDDEFLEAVAREAKRRTEAIEAYGDAGRDDLVAKETAEREVLQAYLPEQLSDDKVDALVDEAIAATGASSVKELGKVMGHVMGKAKGLVDGTVVQQKARARLEA
ncbi:MAG: GatB/YqeY domain-containing protein [Actinomycetota bacterium]